MNKGNVYGRFHRLLDSPFDELLEAAFAAVVPYLGIRHGVAEVLALREMLRLR